MPRTSPYQIELPDDEPAELERRARAYSSPYRDVVRAKIVLYGTEGMNKVDSAERLDTSRQVVSDWRKRFFEHGLAGLEELPRGGRPSGFPPDVVVAIKALACELPAATGCRWRPGTAPSWPARPSSPASSRRSPGRRCGGG